MKPTRLDGQMYPPALVLFLFLLTTLLLPTPSFGGYNSWQEGAYLSNFDGKIADSYGEADHTPFLDPCKNSLPISNSDPVVLTAETTEITSTEVKQQCSSTQACVVPPGKTLIMTESLDVGSLTVEGHLQWTDDTQSSDQAYLCAGFVVTEGVGSDYYMTLREKQAYIFIKNNGARHSQLATRVFAGNNGGRVEIVGRHMERTWSILDKPLAVGDSKVKLLHDPLLMKWRVGDRIGVAPTEGASGGKGQVFKITEIVNGTITLDSASTKKHEANFFSTKNPGQIPVTQSAEVVNLSRNIIITGDDFEHIPCDPSQTSNTKFCTCTGERTTCTVGLHTVQAHSGVMRVSNTRVEKCGQRGIMGKYWYAKSIQYSCTILNLFFLMEIFSLLFLFLLLENLQHALSPHG